MSMYVYVCMYVCVCMYIYIYIERERDACVCECVCMQLRVYMFIFSQHKRFLSSVGVSISSSLLSCLGTSPKQFKKEGLMKTPPQTGHNGFLPAGLQL